MGTCWSATSPASVRADSDLESLVRRRVAIGSVFDVAFVDEDLSDSGVVSLWSSLTVYVSLTGGLVDGAQYTVHEPYDPAAIPTMSPSLATDISSSLNSNS